MDLINNVVTKMSRRRSRITEIRRAYHLLDGSPRNEAFSSVEEALATPLAPGAVRRPLWFVQGVTDQDERRVRQAIPAWHGPSTFLLPDGTRFVGCDGRDLLYLVKLIKNL